MELAVGIPKPELILMGVREDPFSVFKFFSQMDVNTLNKSYLTPNLYLNKHSPLCIGPCCFPDTLDGGQKRHYQTMILKLDASSVWTLLVRIPSFRDVFLYVWWW